MRSILFQYFVSCDGFAGEHYELRLSTTDNLNTSFTEVLLSETLSNTSYEARVIDLSAYKGQTIYLAWHHCDCTDVMSLLLDTVTVIGAGGEIPEPVPGDVNGSGAIETGMHSRSPLYARRETLRRNSFTAADFDGSGTVDQAGCTAHPSRCTRNRCIKRHGSGSFPQKAGETEQLTHS